MISYQSINSVWEDSRRLGILSQLYRERSDDWALLKCAKTYAKRRGFIRSIKLVKFLDRVISRLQTRIHEAYRRAKEKLNEFSQAAKFSLGIWGSAGLRGELLRFYLDLKNARVPRQILVEV